MVFLQFSLPRYAGLTRLAEVFSRSQTTAAFTFTVFQHQPDPVDNTCHRNSVFLKTSHRRATASHTSMGEVQRRSSDAFHLPGKERGIIGVGEWRRSRYYRKRGEMRSAPKVSSKISARNQRETNQPPPSAGSSDATLRKQPDPCSKSDFVLSMNT